MKRWVRVHNRSHENTLLGRARWCDTYFCRMRGLTFRRALPEGEALLLVESSEGRINTSIHMMFVFFPISVFWLSSTAVVVDKRLARPWGFYAPQQAAQYILEASPALLEDIHLGDQLVFIDEDQA